MRLLIHFLTFLTSLASLVHANQFQSGLDFYEKGAYQEALEHFKSSLSSGETAALRHNLALTYFQLGEPATAVWQIERALALEPFNGKYQYKLEALRSQLGLLEDKLAWYALAGQSLTLNQWILLAASGFWIVAALYLFPIIGGYRRTSGLKAARIVAIGLLGLSVAAIILQARGRKDGIIIAGEATTLHVAPANAAPETGTARPGERARIIDRHNDFLKIQTEGQATGWIAKDAFRKLVNEPTPGFTTSRK